MISNDPDLTSPSLAASPGHRQVWVKVNAHVDEGIAGLITALSEFPALQTLESCQGGNGEPAYVCFGYGRYAAHPWLDLAHFVLGFLAPRLAETVGELATLRIRTTTLGLTIAELVVREGAIEVVEEAVRRIAFQAARSAGQVREGSEVPSREGSLTP